jgi:hypothetical protein
MFFFFLNTANFEIISHICRMSPHESDRVMTKNTRLEENVIRHVTQNSNHECFPSRAEWSECSHDV